MFLTDGDQCRSTRLGTAANAHFGLFSELWSKDPLEDPYQNEDEEQPAPKGAKTKAKPVIPTQQQHVAKPKADPLEARRTKCKAELGAIYHNDKGVLDLWRKHMKNRFNGGLKVEESHITVAHLVTEEMVSECESWIKTYAKA